ncbi:hypothetical protein ACEPAF_2466 [Sanghuangporus sanghuang]
MRRGLECTVPPCSCGVPSQEHSAGSFTCSHLSGRKSEASDGTSIGTAEESKIENSVSQFLSFDTLGCDELDALQGPAATDAHFRLQGLSDLSDIQMGGNIITDPNYAQSLSSEYSAFPNSFEDDTQLCGHRSQHGIFPQLSRHAGKDTVQDGSTGMELDIADDRYKHEPRSVGGLRSRSTGMETSIHSEYSSILMSLPSHYQQFSPTTDLGASTSELGLAISDAPATIGGPSQLHGPAPMPMDLSMPVFVPDTPSCLLHTSSTLPRISRLTMFVVNYGFPRPPQNTSVISLIFSVRVRVLHLSTDSSKK